MCHLLLTRVVYTRCSWIFSCYEELKDLCWDSLITTLSTEFLKTLIGSKLVHQCCFSTATEQLEINNCNLTLDWNKLSSTTLTPQLACRVTQLWFELYLTMISAAKFIRLIGKLNLLKTYSAWRYIVLKNDLSQQILVIGLSMELIPCNSVFDIHSDLQLTCVAWNI